MGVMTPRTVRRVVVSVCVLGVAGMIVASIADESSAALTAGLITAAASLCLMVATAVTATPRRPDAADPEAIGAELEERIRTLVASGTDESALRSLVRTAIRLGRES